MWKHVRDFDIVHVHMSRDLVTMPAALIARMRGVPYVLQTHGMIDASSRRSAKLLDALATRRIISRARRVFVLTSREKDDIGSLMGKRPFVCELLQNGIEVIGEPSAWPVAADVPEALFCSRLHARKRPRAFVQAALDLLSDGIKARFVLAGPDEGELLALDDMLEHAGRPEGIVVEPAIEPADVDARLARCSFMVLPSVDEPFPMIVLESLAAGRAVVITASCGLADFVRGHSCGVVVAPDDQQGLTTAIRDLILSPTSAHEMGTRGVAAVKTELSIEVVVDQLSEAYERTIPSTH
jgi:glycosyltransferase involved in cell wall biosynthesis